ncbi:hypothetical protein ACFX19_020095 [Malus domestica]
MLIKSYSMPFTVDFVLAMAFVVAKAQQMQSNISRESSLTPTTNSSWLSCSVWTANRDDPPLSSNVTLNFSSDGFSLTSTPDQSFVIEYTSGSSASMLDSGSFVIYNARQDIVWHSFELLTDTLLPGQSPFAED